MLSALLSALAALGLVAGEKDASLLAEPERRLSGEGPAAPLRPKLASLAGGASLGAGGAAWLVTAGYPALSLAYGQGMGETDDLGALLQADFIASEILLAGWWRRQIVRGAGSQLALRLRAGFYACLGSTWVYSENRGDTGLQLSGGVAWSVDTGAGLFTLAGDMPLTWTFARGMGWILAPKATAAFETPLFGDVTAGGRAGVGIRGAGGGAPGSGSPDRLLVEVSVLATWRLF
jgi:hypothetical protein